MPPDDIKTKERVVPGENDATRSANADAVSLTGATAAPDGYYYCPKSPYQKQLEDQARPLRDAEVARQWKGITDFAEQAGYDLTTEYGQRMTAMEASSLIESANFAQNRPLSDYLSGNDANNLAFMINSDRNIAHLQSKEFASSPSDYADLIKKRCAEKQAITAETKLGAIDSTFRTASGMGEQYAKLTNEAALAALGARTLSPRGVFSVRRPPAKVEAVETGEPVSVANGEYLETWRDFLIPGTFAFDGARYMGLKLGLPGRYRSPLGACQISMFDEIFSNPERGQLVFHNDEGKRIGFERPFNFLPATNAGYPHLELKAPWLRQLTLKDGRITKHFRQYADGFYRLEKIEDLNGFELMLTRTIEGWLVRADGPDGLSLAFENDAKGRRTKITLIGTDGSELELAAYSYDQRGRMLSADCAFGMSVRYQWQEAKDLIASWHNITRASETHFTYDEQGRVVHTATNGIWNDDRFDYRAGETAYLPGGNGAAAQRFQYDENENITAEIDALGGTVSHRYNRAGFRIATKDANGFESSTRYDTRGNPQESRDAEGRVTTHIWGDNGELMLVIDGAGNKRRYEHDFQSNVIAETDAEGHATRLVRDDKGRVIETHFPNGSVERRSWDEHNRLATVTDAKGNTTRFDYDVFGRQIAVTNALGHVTRRSYHAGAGGFDAPTEITRPDGVTVTRSFDEQGLVSVVRDGEGRGWRYENAAFGVLASITDPKGGKLSFGYDIEGRILTVTNAVGRVYRFGRDLAGRVIEEEDFDGRIRRYERDAAGQVTAMLKPDGARLTYAYDKSGLLRRIESFAPDAVKADGKPQDVTRLWYDARGLLVRAENKAALVSFERDRNGRIVGETLNGVRTKSTRDAMGQRILRDMTGSAGGLTDYVRDPLGQVERLTAGEAGFNFSHDALGRETRRITTRGFSLDQRFDAVGQLTEQQAGGAAAAVNRVSPFGVNVPLGGGPQSPTAARRIYEYDRAFAPVVIDDALWGQTRLAYDDNGQLASAVGRSNSENFAYDAARNVTGASSVVHQAGIGGASYRGVPMERWTSTPGGVVQIARGPKGERIRLIHDACGRLTERHVERDGFRPRKWRYGWDVHDRLVSCIDPGGDEWLYRYDPFGRRVSKVRKFSEAERRRAVSRWPELVSGDGSPSATTGASNDNAWHPDDLPQVGAAFLWDGDHMVAEAPLHLGGRVAWDEAIRWHFEEDEGATHRLLAKELPAGAKLPDGSALAAPALFPIVCDHLGTPKEMFDEKGNLVWAVEHHVWGEVRATRTFGNLVARSSHEPLPEDLQCPWRFPGQYEDAETGLYYNRHRHYDPLTAQYVSPDPIGLAGGDRPQGYVQNPTTWIDPLGLAATARSEIFYRTMSKADFEHLQRTGKIRPTSETFVSPSEAYSRQYDGVVVKFETRPGTKAALEKLGGRHKGNPATAREYPNMPDAGKGWAQTGTMFKSEGGVSNIGLGRGPGIDTFNNNITRFESIQ